MRFESYERRRQKRSQKQVKGRERRAIVARQGILERMMLGLPSHPKPGRVYFYRSKGERQ